MRRTRTPLIAAVLLAGALFYDPHPANAQGYVALECVGQYDTAGNGPTTRNEWITVTPVGGEPGGCHIASANGGPWDSPDDAAKIADSIMLGVYPGGINPNSMGGTYRVAFPAVCLRAFDVWRNPDGTMFVTHMGAGEGAVVAARLQSGLCCEGAMNYAGLPISSTNDCRVVELQSQPGKFVALGRDGWMSLSGPISIALPAPLPPISFGLAPGSVLPNTTLQGTWVMPDGSVYRFVQNGNQIQGAYRGGRGHEQLTGTFVGTTNDGVTTSGTYTNREGSASSSGPMTFTVQNGQLIGTWASNRPGDTPHSFGGGVPASGDAQPAQTAPTPSDCGPCGGPCVLGVCAATAR